VATTAGIWRFGLGKRKTLRHRRQPSRQSDRRLEIEHSALGWKKFREKLQPYGSIPFAIETSQGVAVEQLLEAGMLVYPLNPKSAQAYRERKAPAGSKTIDWMLGVLLMPCGWMVKTGKHSGQRSH